MKALAVFPLLAAATEQPVALFQPLYHQLLSTTTSVGLLQQDPSSARKLTTWAADCRDCDAATWNNQLARDPTLRTCTYCELQWDEAGTLVANQLFTVGSYVDAFGFTNSLITLVWLATYNGNNGGLCSMFDHCVDKSSGINEVIPNQYAYDCSNVYCGPNAIRDCNGNNFLVPCPDGTPQPPVIPSLQQVTCQVSRNSYPPEFDSLCGDCVELDNGLYQVVCGLDDRTFCSDSDGGEECLTYGLSKLVYAESLKAVQDCHYSTSNPEDEFCRNTYFQGLPVNQCIGELNGMTCTSCSVCGQAAAGVDLVSVDCSEIVLDSRYNECEGAYSGFFSPLAGQLQEDGAASVPLPTVPLPTLEPQNVGMVDIAPSGSTSSTTSNTSTARRAIMPAAVVASFFVVSSFLMELVC